MSFLSFYLHSHFYLIHHFITRFCFHLLQLVTFWNPVEVFIWRKHKRKGVFFCSFLWILHYTCLSVKKKSESQRTTALLKHSVNMIWNKWNKKNIFIPMRETKTDKWISRCGWDWEPMIKSTEIRPKKSFNMTWFSHSITVLNMKKPIDLKCFSISNESKQFDEPGNEGRC